MSLFHGLDSASVCFCGGSSFFYLFVQDVGDHSAWSFVVAVSTNFMIEHVYYISGSIFESER